jgi:hypothetical protein
MIILAGGDSFVWGTELADCRNHGPAGFSYSTWQAQLAKLNSFEYACVAKSGAGNTIVARNVIRYCETNNNVFPIVQWTWPWRFDVTCVNPSNNISEWETIGPWAADEELRPGKKLNKDDKLFDYAKQHTLRAKQSGINELANVFFKHVALGEYWPVYNTLKEIVFLQNYLRSKHIPYMFACVDNCILYNETLNKQDPYVTDLVNQIDLVNWAWLPTGTGNNETKTPRGFYQWATENKYDIAPGGHPLEQAHIDASIIMQEKFNELVKKHIQ